MSLNTNKDLKMYYSIAEVSRKFGVAGSLLRFWEKEFPNINPKKTERGIRQYTAQDIEEIRIVYNLLKVKGMKIAAAKAALKKAFLHKMRKILCKINFKNKGYK